MGLKFFVSFIFFAGTFINVKGQFYDRDSLQKILDQLRKLPTSVYPKTAICLVKLLHWLQLKTI